MQSEPKSCPQNQSGKQLKLQQVKIQTERTVNRISGSLPKGGHSVTNLTKFHLDVHIYKHVKMKILVEDIKYISPYS